MKRVINVRQHPGILDWCKEHKVNWILLDSLMDPATFKPVIIKVGVKI